MFTYLISHDVFDPGRKVGGCYGQSSEGKLAFTPDFGVQLQYIELVMTQMPIPSRNISNQITFMNESLVWVQDNQWDSSLSWFAGSKGDQGHVTSLISYSLQHSYHDIIKILHLTIPFKVHRIPPGCHKVHHLPGAIFTMIPPSHKIKEKSILSMTTAKTQINIF